MDKKMTELNAEAWLTASGLYTSSEVLEIVGLSVSATDAEISDKASVEAAVAADDGYYLDQDEIERALRGMVDEVRESAGG
jgi:hypothetical protein